eukprot:TRINITY_DN87365_c0_g1_i1.p1 TRINITY_DN87365_c0_g1~~TRINITY_DN87365_c0_g1_i1.p1  ORF type:complete len:539 (+),score=101.06 TRINITY_DN87365_c0_g1_i1:83-1618(+)
MAPVLRTASPMAAMLGSGLEPSELLCESLCSSLDAPPDVASHAVGALAHNLELKLQLTSLQSRLGALGFTSYHQEGHAKYEFSDDVQPIIDSLQELAETLLNNNGSCTAELTRDVVKTAHDYIAARQQENFRGGCKLADADTTNQPATDEHLLRILSAMTEGPSQVCSPHVRLAMFGDQEEAESHERQGEEHKEGACRQRVFSDENDGEEEQNEGETCRDTTLLALLGEEPCVEDAENEVWESHMEESPNLARKGSEIALASLLGLEETYSRKVPKLRVLPAGTTTLVIRNVPARYDQEMLLLEWDPSHGFDFLHLPYSIRERRTMGYAFLNFRTHDLARKFQLKVQSTFLSAHGHTKHLDVAAATNQGLEANLRQFKGRNLNRMLSKELLPIIFDQNGVRLDTEEFLVNSGLVEPRDETTSPKPFCSPSPQASKKKEEVSANKKQSAKTPLNAAARPWHAQQSPMPVGPLVHMSLPMAQTGTFAMVPILQGAPAALMQFATVQVVQLQRA